MNSDYCWYLILKAIKNKTCQKAEYKRKLFLQKLLGFLLVIVISAIMFFWLKIFER